MASDEIHNLVAEAHHAVVRVVIVVRCCELLRQMAGRSIGEESSSMRGIEMSDIGDEVDDLCVIGQIGVPVSQKEMSDVDCPESHGAVDAVHGL